MNTNLAYQIEPKEEIIDGKVVMMAPSRSNHNRVTGNLSTIFMPFLRGKTCEYFPDGEGLFLSESEQYIPDGMVVCDPDKVQDDGIHGAPDLVIEVLSHSTAKFDKGHKKDVYEAAGVREYWIVDPANKLIEQYLLQGGKYILHDLYAVYPDTELMRMKPEERAAVVTEFKCSLYDDLIIRLEDVFDRVP